MYNDWFSSKDLHLGDGFLYMLFTKCELDILRFIAENGPHSIYDVKELGYTYPYIHKNSKKLIKKRLLEPERDTTGPRTKKILKITFRGFVVFILAWKKYEQEAKRSIEASIEKHQSYFPFYNVWDEITQIVGEEEAFKKIIESAKQIVGGSIYEIKINDEQTKLKTFVNDELESRIGLHQFLNSQTIKQKIRNQRINTIIKSNNELKNHYIATLALDDIISLSEGQIKLEETDQLESEKELAKIENLDLDKKHIFSTDKLNELISKYTSDEGAFTGVFLSKLLWETLEPKIIKKEKIKTDFQMQSLEKFL